MMPLTVIARLKAQEGREAELKAMLQGLIAPTRAEKGCLAYDLHQSEEDPSLFFFTESWESRPLWEDHMKSPHLAAFEEKQHDLVLSWELFTGQKIEAATIVEEARR